MTLSDRNRCFVEVAIVILAVAAPSFAQISALGYISDCDQNKALPDYANDNMQSRRMRYLWATVTSNRLRGARWRCIALRSSFSKSTTTRPA